MLVQMELSRVIISEINDQQVIYLRELDGTRTFPILIGPYEAHSINRRLLEEAPLRPLTHQLLKDSIEMLDGTVQDVVIDNLREHTYYAVLRVGREDGEVGEIDSRPSDAIALSVHFEPPLPIYVAETVLEEAV